MEFQQELEALYHQASEFKAQGHPDQAEVLERKAASILTQLKMQVEQHPEDPATAARLLYLAERDWAILGDHETVYAGIQRALALREKEQGPDHPLTAEALAKLAEFHFLAGRLGESEPLYRRALAIYEKYEKDKDPMGAKVLEGLAQTLAALGRSPEADPYFARAIEQSGNDDQGKRSRYFLLIYRADGLDKLKRQAEAAALRQQAAVLLPKNNPGEQGFHV